jgi:hypothetical protein
MPGIAGVGVNPPFTRGVSIRAAHDPRRARSAPRTIRAADLRPLYTRRAVDLRQDQVSAGQLP